MKTVALALLLALAPAVARPAEDAPVVIAYYYKVRWGFQDEFERLFMKNHLPLLTAQRDAGRIKSVSLYKPTFHGDGRADWTFLVVITFASWNAFHAPSGEEELARKLFPDQPAYKKEEARRFEIIDAHWDVPLNPVPIPGTTAKP
jgi:hypothetical protein